MDVRIKYLDCREQDVVRLWRKSGLSQGSIAGYLHWVRRFRIYCDLHGLDETSELTLTGAIKFGSSYIGPRSKGPVGESTRFAARNALHAWACAIHSLKIQVPPWRDRPEPVKLSPLLLEYCQHRRADCGVSDGTLKRDINTAKAFLSLLRSQGKTADKATVVDVDTFVIKLSGRLSKRTVADACSSLRGFFRFLQISGRLHENLSACVMAPRVRATDRPPRTLPWTQVRQILRSIPRTQSPGKRDFAMLLLMATYGLGAAEVLQLRLEDVDWKLEVLRVRRPKTGVSIDLPLLPPVAMALCAYLHKERPGHAVARRFFLRMRMPHEPLTSGAIRHRIRFYARRAGITAHVIGAHAFRHSHASRQIDAGANPKVVGDILGHRNPSSTSVYVRVAIRRLRWVALPVPR
jgi:site-specific recombinase XerD